MEGNMSEIHKEVNANYIGMIRNLGGGEHSEDKDNQAFVERNFYGSFRLNACS